MTSYVYSNGLPFENTLARNLTLQNERVDRGKASMIIIDGAMGEGKSTLAIHIADYIQGESTDLTKQIVPVDQGKELLIQGESTDLIQGENIDLTKQYAFGGDELAEKLQLCIDSKKRVLIYDEAGDFSRRGALTKFNRQLNRIFETYRAFNIIIILVLPLFSVLDKGIFDKQVPRMLINCYKRRKTYGRYRVYSLASMFWLRDKMNKNVVPSQAYSYQWPNFFGVFKDLPPARRKKLDEISVKGKSEVLTTATLQNKGLVSYKQIAKEIGRSKQWVYNKVTKLGFKEKLKKGKKKYFDKSVVERLREEMKTR